MADAPAVPGSFVHFRTARHRDWRAGVLMDGHVRALASDGRTPSPVTIDDLLDRGALTESVEAAADVTGGDFVALDQAGLEFGPPVLRPSKILCVGFNYREHAQEFELEVPDSPTLFAKFSNCLIGHNAPIRLPSISSQIDYEGELAVVIGRTAKDVPASAALGQVAGYSLFNDVTARDLQFATSQYTLGKALDTFAPMGPGLVPASSVPDPQDLVVNTYLDGQRVQHGDTALMLFPVAELIARISAVMTLFPGDVIATGTPSGVGYKRVPPLYLTNGATVEVEIDGVGLLRNPVVTATAKSVSDS